MRTVEIDVNTIAFLDEPQESFGLEKVDPRQHIQRRIVELRGVKSPQAYFSPLRQHEVPVTEVLRGVPSIDLGAVEPEQFVASGYYSDCFLDQEGRLVKVFRIPPPDVSEGELPEYYSIQYSQLEYYVRHGGLEDVSQFHYAVQHRGLPVGFAQEPVRHTHSLDEHLTSGQKVHEQEVANFLGRLRRITDITGLHHGDLVSLVETDGSSELLAYVNTRNILMDKGALRMIDFNPGGFFNIPVTIDQEYALLKRFLERHAE